MGLKPHRPRRNKLLAKTECCCRVQGRGGEEKEKERRRGKLEGEMWVRCRPRSFSFWQHIAISNLNCSIFIIIIIIQIGGEHDGSMHVELASDEGHLPRIKSDFSSFNLKKLKVLLHYDEENGACKEEEGEEDSRLSVRSPRRTRQ